MCQQDIFGDQTLPKYLIHQQQQQQQLSCPIQQLYNIVKYLQTDYGKALVTKRILPPLNPSSQEMQS